MNALPQARRKDVLSEFHERGMEKVALAVLAALGVLLVLCVVTLATVPPVAKDELVHHLAVPKLYLKHGGMIEIPFMPFSYYPMNLDLLYLIPLYLGNDIVPKYIHFGFAVLTAMLLFTYLKRRTGIVFALFGAVFFLSIPIIVKLSTCAYIDLGVLFFSFASLLLLLKWAERGFQTRVLILSGVMAGLAMGTKYNGLITTALLTLFVPTLYARRAQGRFFSSALHGALFLSAALLVFSPWMVRNYSWKQNPVYPLFDRAFNPQKNGHSENGMGQSVSIRPGPGVFVIREGIYQETGWEIALVPLRVFFEGKDGSPKHFDGKLSPFLLLFSVFAFWRTRDDEEKVRYEKWVMLAFVSLFFAIAFFTSDLRIRYIAPILPVLALLSAMGAEKLLRAVRRCKPGRWKNAALLLLWVAMASALAYNGRYVFALFKEVEPLGYLAGAVSRDEYLDRHRPEYAAMRFINDHLPQDAKIMLLFMGDRGYYCDRQYVFGEGVLGTVFRESGDSRNILVGLQREKVTHLFIHDPFFQRWAQDSLSEVERSRLDGFFKKYTGILFNRSGFYVLSLQKP